jgi:hypothetical protein
VYQNLRRYVWYLRHEVANLVEKIDDPSDWLFVYDLTMEMVATAVANKS